MHEQSRSSNTKSPIFGKKDPKSGNEQLLNLKMSKISQDDIENRNTFEEIENNNGEEDKKGFVSSIMSIKENVTPQ